MQDASGRRARGIGAWLRAGWRITYVAAIAATALVAGCVLKMLYAGDRDAVAYLRHAPPMRIVETPSGAAGDRTRRLAFADHIGSVQATIRYAPRGAGRAPVIVVLGGLGTGQRAVDLVNPRLPYAVAALDYAWTGPPRTSAPGLLFRAPIVQRDLMRTAVALRDLMSFLERDPRIAGRRIYLLGASLGSPIAAAAAAAVRPAGLVLLYGFADHAALLEYRLRPHVTSTTLRVWIARAGAAFTANLDAEHTLPRLRGTSILMICAPDDRDLPRRCSDALWNAAREPRRRIDLPGGHIRGRRDAELLLRATAIVMNWLAEMERARGEPRAHAVGT